MATTYTLISSNVLTGSAASVTFSSIPSTYTDLVLTWSARNTDTGGTYFTLQLNGDTATNYSITRLDEIQSTTVQSNRTSSATSIIWNSVDSSSNAANTFSSGEIYIPSYTVSQNKPLSSFSVQEDNATTNTNINAVAGLWRNTATISSLTATSLGGTSFVSGSSFYLYGVKNS